MSDVKITKLARELAQELIDMYEGETIKAEDKTMIGLKCQTKMFAYCKGATERIAELEGILFKDKVED